MVNDTKYRDLLVIRSTCGKVGNKYFIQPSKDPRTGRYPDCVKFVDSKGDLILTDEERNSGKIWIGENQVFEIVDGTTFDLENPYDKAKWEAIKHCPLIAPSRTAKDSRGKYLIDGDTKMRGDYKSVYSTKYGIAELYIETPEREVQEKVSKKKLQHKAMTYIIDDERGSAGRALIAKLLGKSMRGASDAEIEAFLLSVAEKDPNRVIDLYTGDDSALRLLFIEAKEKGVIFIKNKLYMFGEGTVLGPTDDSVITWMKTPKNNSIVDLIRRETNPDLYLNKLPNYGARVNDPTPETYNSGTGDVNPVETKEINTVVEIKEEPTRKK